MSATIMTATLKRIWKHRYIYTTYAHMHVRSGRATLTVPCSLRLFRLNADSALTESRWLLSRSFPLQHFPVILSFESMPCYFINNNNDVVSGYHTTPANHNVTPTRIEPDQYNPWNNSTNKSQAPEDGCTNFRDIIKQVTSSWSIFILLSRWCKVQ